MSQSPAPTLAARLEQRLIAEPDAVACHFVGPDGSSEAVSVRRLFGKAMAYAEALGSPGSARMVAVCLYQGIDLHAAFLGALWAGHVPTMVAPPSPRMETRKYTESLRGMLRHVQPDVLIVSDETLSRSGGDLGAESKSTHLLVADGVADLGDVAPRVGAPDDIAVLQHSSGTTGLQKGVALSHREILAHNAAYAAHLNITPQDRIVSWLPLYHDMGFVACFLLPLLERIPLVQMSPFDWVLRPAMLLEQIHNHRSTLCWMPNFAFTFMAEGIRNDQLAPEIDLACMRAWVNCSEPVSEPSFRKFVARFSAHGVTSAQLTASYAMAENVFAVTQSLPGQLRVLRARRGPFVSEHRIEEDDGPDALSFVSNGAVVAGTEVAVLDESAAPLADDRVGELVLRGAFRFTGYHRREELTSAAFSDGWYRTGDLGFVHGGEVYVTGREKDLIIVQGRNLYPGDIEEVVARVPGVQPGRVVAFGVRNEDSGTEGLVVLAEPAAGATKESARISLDVRRTIAQELDFAASDVRVVPPRWLIESTSGKLARNDNRMKYLSEFRAVRDV